MLAVAERTAEPQTGWTTLFNDPRFHALNLRADERTVTVPYEEDGRAVGALTGVVGGDGVFTSGHSAPFGGPDFARDRESPRRVRRTLAAAVAELSGHRLRIRCRPAGHGENEAAVVFALTQLGFRVTDAELAATIDLTKEYLPSLRSPARRALKHAATEPFALARCADWEQGYALLSDNREAKGRRLSLSLDYLLGAAEALPGAIEMHELRYDGRPVAAAVVFAVNARVDYVYAWGDAQHALRRSPMNALARAVVERSRARGAAALDLGGSTVPGVRRAADEGLVQFKRSVGARLETRLVMER